MKHCRSPYGERGLKSPGAPSCGRSTSRSPYGERGLKSYSGTHDSGNAASLSLRRAWIEMALCESRSWICMGSRSPYGERGLKWHQFLLLGQHTAGRSPYGERGLKSSVNGASYQISAGRSPYGERGLKSQSANDITASILSLSLRRAWIEISTSGGS